MRLLVRRNRQVAELAAAQFNSCHPVGSPVLYHELPPGDPRPCRIVRTTVRSRAWVMGDVAVVMLAGITGCVMTLHVTPEEW